MCPRRSTVFPKEYCRECDTLSEMSGKILAKQAPLYEKTRNGSGNTGLQPRKDNRSFTANNYRACKDVKSQYRLALLGQIR